jgi:hypothetical protein
MDLNSITDIDSAEVVITDPTTGAPTDLVFTMAGPEHAKRKQLEMARARKIRRQVQKTGKVELGDPEDDLEDQIEMLVACTLGWIGLTDKGVAVAYSDAAKQTLLNNEKLGWLRMQLLNALGERERFIKSSAPA